MNRYLTLLTQKDHQEHIFKDYLLPTGEDAIIDQIRERALVEKIVRTPVLFQQMRDAYVRCGASYPAILRDSVEAYNVLHGGKQNKPINLHVAHIMGVEIFLTLLHRCVEQEHPIQLSDELLMAFPQCNELFHVHEISVMP